MKKQIKALPKSKWVDYLLSFSIAFLLVVILGFIYIEDVKHGIGVLCTEVISVVLPDLMM